MPPVHWQNLRPDDSPLARLPRSSSLQLVVAPPSADVRAFAALSRQQQLSVLFPFQRGPSIETLSNMDGRERLWPLVPSLRDDLRATAEATLNAGWGRAMVVTDPKALEATVTTAFVDLYQAAGGQVHSYEASPVQQVDPDDSQRLDRFRDDMAWSATPTVVVADRRRPWRHACARINTTVPWVVEPLIHRIGSGLLLPMTSRPCPRCPGNNWVWSTPPGVRTGRGSVRRSPADGGKHRICWQPPGTTPRVCWRWWRRLPCRHPMRVFAIPWGGWIPMKLQSASAAQRRRRVNRCG